MCTPTLYTRVLTHAPPLPWPCSLGLVVLMDIVHSHVIHPCLRTLHHLPAPCSLGLVVLMDIVHSHASKNTMDGINMFDGEG